MGETLLRVSTRRTSSDHTKPKSSDVLNRLISLKILKLKESKSRRGSREQKRLIVHEIWEGMFPARKLQANLKPSRCMATPSYETVWQTVLLVEGSYKFFEQLVAQNLRDGKSDNLNSVHRIRSAG